MYVCMYKVGSVVRQKWCLVSFNIGIYVVGNLGEFASNNVGMPVTQALASVKVTIR